MTSKKEGNNFGELEQRFLTLNLQYRSMVLFTDGVPRFTFTIPPEWVRIFKKHYWPTVFPQTTASQNQYFNYTDVSPIRTDKNYISSQYSTPTFRYNNPGLEQPY